MNGWVVWFVLCGIISLLCYASAFMVYRALHNAYWDALKQYDSKIPLGRKAGLFAYGIIILAFLVLVILSAELAWASWNFMLVSP